jgi:hypothetical protein
MIRDVLVGLDRPQNLQFGYEVAGVQWGKIRAGIVADPYQINHLVSADNDIGYAALSLPDWGFSTTKSGIGWKDWSGGGTYLVQTGGTQNLEAAYGAYGTFRCENTGHQIYAGVGTDS